MQVQTLGWRDRPGQYDTLLVPLNTYLWDEHSIPLGWRPCAGHLALKCAPVSEISKFASFGFSYIDTSQTQSRPRRVLLPWAA